jgi:hypothetical protein
MTGVGDSRSLRLRVSDGTQTRDRRWRSRPRSRLPPSRLAAVSELAQHRPPDHAPAGPLAAAAMNRTTQLYSWRGRLLCRLFRVVPAVVRSLAVNLLGGPDSLRARGPAAARPARASCSQPADAPGSGRSARDACSSRGAALGPAPGIRGQSDSGRTTATSRAGAPPRPGTARPLALPRGSQTQSRTRRSPR